MKLNHLHLIEEGIKRIAAVTDTDTTEIIEALTGVAWDEEEAGSIREFMIDASADESRRGEKPKVNDLIERLRKDDWQPIETAPKLRERRRTAMTDLYSEWRDFYAEKVRSWMSLEELRAECGKLQTVDNPSPEVLLVHAMHTLEKLQAELEQLKSYYKNGIDCFAEPCERHSGKNAPPFSEFFEKYGGLCLICVVDNNKALQAENERLRNGLDRVIELERDKAPFTCKYCGQPSWIDPSDQLPPPDYCHEIDHGTSEDRAVFGSGTVEREGMQGSLRKERDELAKEVGK